MIKTTVVSAINIVDGGALTVLQDAMKAFDSNADTEHSVIFLVSNPSVHSGIELKHIKFIYFPLSKKSWFLRFFYEYVYFYLLSLKIKPHTWFSLHDTTPSQSLSTICLLPQPINFSENATIIGINGSKTICLLEIL